MSGTFCTERPNSMSVFRGTSPNLPNQPGSTVASGLSVSPLASVPESELPESPVKSFVASYNTPAERIPRAIDLTERSLRKFRREMSSRSCSISGVIAISLVSDSMRGIGCVFCIAAGFATAGEEVNDARLPDLSVSTRQICPASSVYEIARILVRA